jgi:HSP20 family protein
MNGVDLLDRLHADFESIFGNLLYPEAPSRGTKFPAVNVWEDESNVYVECEIPGVRKEQLDLSVVGRKLTISGERTRPESEDVRRHRTERPEGAFTREVTLPRAVNPEAIEARLESGILTVTLPRSEAEKPRKIVVK